MEINGLPVHALVVHAAVVFGPLAALAGVLYAVPKWRDKLRWPLVAHRRASPSGRSGSPTCPARRSRRPTPYGGELAELVETHEERAEILRLLDVRLRRRVVRSPPGSTRAPGRSGSLLAGLVAVLAVLTGIWVGLTGDAGAQIAWFGVNG